jgi:ribosomal protein S18 acetylase RimI-like enzyme
MENTNHNNINKFDKSAYLGLLVGEQKYKRIGVAKQIIIISVKWLNENLGIENMLLSVYNSNIHALRLYQKLGFWRISDRGKNGLFMNFNINELKNNDS